jgi:hypothetical protein
MTQIISDQLAGVREPVIDDKSAIQALIKSACGYKPSASSLPEFLVVISQDCDILHHRIEDEPYIDLLPGCYDRKDGNLFHGKNPRKLQIEHSKKILSFVIFDILRVTKVNFEKINPKHTSIALDRNNIKLIINWISKRYARSAFPDEFMNRLNNSKQHIDKARKSQFMDIVSLIFIDITGEELKSEQNYNITMLIGIQHDSDQKIISQIEDIFYEAFNIPGIEAEVEVHDEYDITYKVISTYKRFDWDFRSLPGDSNVAAPLNGIDAV